MFPLSEVSFHHPYAVFVLFSNELYVMFITCRRESAQPFLPRKGPCCEIPYSVSFMLMLAVYYEKQWLTASANVSQASYTQLELLLFYKLTTRGG